MQILEEWVLESLLDFDSSLWVHIEHLVKQVDRFGRVVGEHRLQILFRLFWQRFNVL